jgi:hypothetical protein
MFRPRVRHLASIGKSGTASPAHGLTEMPCGRRSSIMANLRNLALRPAKPALNRGRVQRLARRALIVLGIASTSEVMEWTCCRKRLHGRRIECHDYRAALFVTVGGRPEGCQIHRSPGSFSGHLPRLLLKEEQRQV